MYNHKSESSYRNAACTVGCLYTPDQNYFLPFFALLLLPFEALVSQVSLSSPTRRLAPTRVKRSANSSGFSSPGLPKGTVAPRKLAV
mmetsp:Transcript_29927/g.34305  ORF Transcript_29927/g.34305 Transcript_29927/m.34305 type:complete len:87 (+) Transcript_29927:160-420(+)